MDSCPVDWVRWRAASVALKAHVGVSTAEKKLTNIFNCLWLTPRHMKNRRTLKNKGLSTLEVSPPAATPEQQHCHPQGLLYLRELSGISWLALVAMGMLQVLRPTPHTCLPLSSPRSQGWLRGGCWLDPLQESRWLAPFPQHLPGVVCDCAGGRFVQRWGDGTADVRDPALHLRSFLCREKRKWPSYYRWEKRSRERSSQRGSIFHT